ncbi:hypothetical protein ILYODFUR_038512 [Ilyodon furcidens]|uniref:Uncharacterized protein n=1 Tax=Ilyodon furcidens TaxID=33524 RepID=A0ABV0U468_9TELE
MSGHGAECRFVVWCGCCASLSPPGCDRQVLSRFLLAECKPSAVVPSPNPLDQITDSLSALRALPVHPPTPYTNWRNLPTPHADLPTSVSMVCSFLRSLIITTKKEPISEA